MLIAGLSVCSVVHLFSQAPEQSHQRRFENATVRLTRLDEELTRTIAASPNDAESFRQRGLVRLQQGRVEDALSDLQSAVRLEPRSSQALTDLATGLFDSGKPQEAITQARQAISLDEHNFAAQALLGRLLLVTGGDIHEAIAHMSRSLDINADQPDLRFDLISALRRVKDFATAGVQVRILGVSLPPGDARREYAEASIDLDLAHADAAILHLRRALQANPNFVPAQQDLTAALIQLGRWQEASEVLGPLVQSRPQSAQLAYMDALVLENTHHAEAAEAEANRALALNPKSADAYVALGISQALEGRHESAVKSLENAVTLQADNFDAQFYLGRERYALNDAAGAALALQSAVQLRSQDAEARFLLGTALESAGDKEKAMEQYRQLVQLRPDDPRGHLGLGNILLRYGENDEAMAELTKARNLDPKNFETAMDIGKILAKQGNLDESIRYLREASRKAPSSPEAHYQLALALRRAGRNTEAAREFAEVNRLNQERRGASPASPN
jgi:tetratricopeptide (TPR) repeat protein